MKNIYLILILLSGVVFTACDTDDFTGEALAVPVGNISATIDVSAVENSYLEANQDTVSVTLTLNDVQATSNLLFYATQTGGDATLGDDVYFIDTDGQGAATKTLAATAESTSATWTFVINNDCISEGTESITIQFGDNRTANTAVTPVEVTFDVVNYRSEVVEATVEWGTDLEGEDITFGNGTNSNDVSDIDIDIYLVTINENGDITGQTSSNAGGTGANPEVLPLASYNFATGESSVLADGTYYLFASIYQTWSAGAGYDPVEYPLFVNFDRCGGDLASSLVYNGFTSEGAYDAEEDDYFSGALLYRIIANNGELTVTDVGSDVVLAEGAIEKFTALTQATK